MYKSGYTLKMYQLLEDDFEKVFKYIPPNYYSESERKKIYSPVLSDLLIRAGSQIDSFFGNWDIVQDSSKNNVKLNMKDFKKIDPIIYLSRKELTFLPTFLKTDLQENEKIVPFKDWNEKTTSWWRAYNNVKHNGYTARTDGNLQNAIDALAALFLINCMHEDLLGKLVEHKYAQVGSEAYSLMMTRRQPFQFPKLTFKSNLFEFTQDKEVYFPDNSVAPKPIKFEFK